MWSQTVTRSLEITVDNIIRRAEEIVDKLISPVFILYIGVPLS